jgi:predicted amidohydrolase YtcJ
MRIAIGILLTVSAFGADLIFVNGNVIIDLKGQTVTPGFNDAHLQPHASYAESSPYYMPWLGPDKVHNMDDLIAASSAKRPSRPTASSYGERYDDEKLGRHPTKHDLDLASTEHPISQPRFGN